MLASLLRRSIVSVAAPANGASGVRVVTLSSPETLNAMTPAMGSRFKETITELGKEDGLRAVVLRGEGKAFSAGGDLAFLEARRASTGTANAAVMRDFYENFLSMRTRLPVPIIAAVHGHAVGAGACISLAADIRLVSKSAKIAFTFVKLGLHPGMGGTHMLPRLVGPQQAARLLLTGETVDGAEAARIGLAMECLETDEAMLERAEALAASIAENSSTAVRGLTRSLRLQTDELLERSLWREAECQGNNYNEADFAASLGAMLARQQKK